MTASEFFMQHGAAPVLRVPNPHFGREHGGVADHRREPVLTPRLSHLYRGMHDNDGARVLVDVIPADIAQYLRCPDLRGFHPPDFADLRIVKRVHDSLDVWRAAGAVSTRLRRGFRRQSAAIVSPLGDGALRWRAPRLAHLFE